MPVSILMPALSPTMTEGNLVKWNKKVGDKIKPGDVLAEIETDKATMEVESVDSGTLARIYVEEGAQEVKVNSLIAALLEEGEDESLLANLETQHMSSSVSQPSSEISQQKQSHEGQSAQLYSGSAPNRVRASPLARRIAEQNSVDLSRIQGTGPEGRIIKQDVLLPSSFAPAQKENAMPHHEKSPAPVDCNMAMKSPPAPFQTIQLSGMRKTIAKRLVESKQQVPHFYLQVECRVDQLLAVREQINKNLEKRDIKISVNDMIVKACGVALKRVPEANSLWAGDAIHQLNSCDVAVAVAIEGGLITPIVNNADQRGLVDISVAIKDLVKRAQSGQLKPQEYQGGGFSLSNLGMYGIESFQAIINPPQASILAVGSAIQKPVVDKGQIYVGHVMNCSLSVDHRILDGAVAARFLKEIQSNIENPAFMLV